MASSLIRLRPSLRWLIAFVAIVAVGLSIWIGLQRPKISATILVPRFKEVLTDKMETDDEKALRMKEYLLSFRNGKGLEEASLSLRSGKPAISVRPADPLAWLRSVSRIEQTDESTFVISLSGVPARDQKQLTDSVARNFVFFMELLDRRKQFYRLRGLEGELDHHNRRLEQRRRECKAAADQGADIQGGQFDIAVTEEIIRKLRLAIDVLMMELKTGERYPVIISVD